MAVAMVVGVLAAPGRAGRPVSLGLTLLWAWLAFGYHLAFFRATNPATPLFAVISLGTATLGVTQDLGLMATVVIGVYMLWVNRRPDRRSRTMA